MTAFRRIALILAVVGPGIITANIDNDASGITTYSVAGARYGYALLWTLIPTTVALFVIQEMVARMGVVTGKGLSDLIRENYGVKPTFFIMAGLFFANMGTTIAEFAGWAASWQMLGMSKYLMVPVGALLIWFLVMKGNYVTIERVLLIACFLYFGYVVSGFMAKPDWLSVAKGTLIPTIKHDPEFIMMSIAIIGTTITPWMQFYLQSSIAEKGIRKEHMRLTRIDVLTGSLITDIIAFFIMVACAATLFPSGIHITEASEAAGALRPLAGGYSSVIFGICLANASLLGAIIVPLATSYYICEAMGWERGVNKTFREAPQFMWIYTAMIVMGSVIILIPGAPLVALMVWSSVVNGILLPFVLIFALRLVNDKKIMGEYVNPGHYNVVARATIAVVIGLTVVMVASTFAPFGRLISAVFG